MTRKNRTPEENARREKIRELLQMANIGSMDDIQSLFKEAISEFMENGLEAELDDELGYSKYDYKNKDTDNSRNGHSHKTLRTSFGDVAVSVPRDRKGEFEPQVLKKNQTSISQDIEEKILSMYAKGMTTGDIEAHIQDIYGVEVSDTTVSRIIMCFTAEETALIDGIIVSYFAPQSVSEPIRLRYFETHKHLQEETIDRTDLMNIRSALLFLAPEFRDSVQTGKEIQSLIAKTSSLLSKH